MREAIAQVRALMSEAEMRCCPRQRSHSAVMDWNLPGRGWGTKLDRFAALPKSCLVWARRNGCWSQETLEDFARLVRSIGEVRQPEGPRDHLLWRLHPERWLESLVVKNVCDWTERLDRLCLYSQVPAFSASDRAMIDVLAVTREGRLAVVELKADEDIHLPLQGLDYWSRVAWHHARGEFQQFGYFPGRELSPSRPLLFLVAPALHVHPATDILLRYISPEIEWASGGN